MNQVQHPAGGPRGRRYAPDLADDPNTLRMLALMGGHERIALPALFGHSAPPRRGRRFADHAREGDRAYFRRRSREELSAAERAAGVEARKAHEELARLYVGLAGAVEHRRDRPLAGHSRVLPLAPGDRRKRQDDLLDEALKGTFPASDPVSVAFIR